MAKYIVSFDLRRAKGRDYRRLTKALEGLGGERVLDSQWVVSSTSSAEELRDHLWRYVRPQGRLLVNGVGNKDWAAMNLRRKVSAYRDWSESFPALAKLLHRVNA